MIHDMLEGLASSLFCRACQLLETLIGAGLARETEFYEPSINSFCFLGLWGDCPLQKSSGNCTRNERSR